MRFLQFAACSGFLLCRIAQALVTLQAAGPYSIDVDFFDPQNKLLFSLRGDIPVPNQSTQKESFFMPAELLKGPIVVQSVVVKAAEQGMTIDFFDSLGSATKNASIVPTAPFANFSSPARFDLTSSDAQTSQGAVTFTWFAHDAGAVKKAGGLSIQKIRVELARENTAFKPSYLYIPANPAPILPQQLQPPPQPYELLLQNPNAPPLVLSPQSNSSGSRAALEMVNSSGASSLGNSNGNAMPLQAANNPPGIVPPRNIIYGQ
jgi:hypothetical protein